MHMVNFLIILISSLLSVAFYTILERKILGYIQVRKGPNKVGFMGILQPFSDAIKLFTKSFIITETSNSYLMFISPALTFFLSMMILIFIPFSNQMTFDLTFSVLGFFVLSSLSVYTIILIGWSSNSKYCYLGSIRSVAQMISYEVSLFLIIISITLLSHSFNFLYFKEIQKFQPFVTLTLTLFFMWMITCVAETNRSPFDFAEGESELVSGFNVEYSGGMFAMIFLSEYLSMICLSVFSTVFFLGDIMKIPSPTLIIFISFFFLWIRGTFPRFRYDLLMHLNWKIFLPISISYVILTAFSFTLGL